MQAFRNREKSDLRPKGGIKGVRSKCSGIEWPRKKLPKRVEVLKTSAFWAIVMGGSVVDVGGDPNHILNGVLLDESKDLSKLLLSTSRSSR